PPPLPRAPARRDHAAHRADGAGQRPRRLGRDSGGPLRALLPALRPGGDPSRRREPDRIVRDRTVAALGLPPPRWDARRARAVRRAGGPDGGAVVAVARSAAGRHARGAAVPLGAR